MILKDYNNIRNESEYSKISNNSAAITIELVLKRPETRSQNATAILFDQQVLKPVGNGDYG